MNWSSLEEVNRAVLIYSSWICICHGIVAPYVCMGRKIATKEKEKNQQYFYNVLHESLM